MSRIVFITSLTESYQPYAQRLLSSLKLLKSADAYVMTLDFSMPDNESYKSIRVPQIDLPIKICPQQGHLVDLVPNLSDDDVVIIADADASIQRDLLSDEIYLLKNLGDRVGVANNLGDGQTGLSEAVICQPIVPLRELEKKLGFSLSLPLIYNCGFIAAKPPTWRKAKQMFEQLWPAVSPMFREWRCCQFILCAAFKLAGVDVLNIGYGMHTQGHFPPQKLHAIRDGVLYYGNRPVFFVHHVDGFW